MLLFVLPLVEPPLERACLRTLREVAIDTVVVGIALEIVALDECLDALLDVTVLRGEAHLLHHLGHQLCVRQRPTRLQRQ